MTRDIDELLAAERAAPAAPAAAKARVLDAVRATIALPPSGGTPGDGGPGGGPSGGPMPAGGGATAASMTKLAGLFIAGAVAGAGVHAVVRAPEPAIIEVPVPVVISTPVEIIREVPIVTEPPAQPKPLKRRTASRRKPSIEPKADLAAERVLLEQARTALARRSVTDALAALEAHRARFPAGRLEEERLALEVQALVSAERRAEAEARAAELKSEFPRSLFLPVIEIALEPRRARPE